MNNMNNINNIKTEKSDLAPHHVRFRSTPQSSEIFSSATTDASIPMYDKQASAPIAARPKSFEYITDDTDSSYEGANYEFDEQQRPTVNNNKYKNKKDHIEIIQIQSQLKKWIGSQQHLILSQFIELMKKIAPHISTQDATEMFNRVDEFNDGQIPTKVLLLDEFLPRMILKLFQDDGDEYESSYGDIDSNDNEDNMDNDEDDDEEYKSMDIKQLKEETKRLRKWIVEHGQPAVEKAMELQEMINVYENERGDQAMQLQQKKEVISHLGDLETELKVHRATSGLLMVDKEQLLLKVEESENRHGLQQNKLQERDKELKRYKKLAKEMTVINDKYLKKNELLNDDKARLEEEAQDLRQIILQYENESMQIYQDHLNEMENIKMEMEKLKLELDTKTMQATVAEEYQANDIRSIAGGNKTITIDRDKLSESTMDKIVRRQSSSTQNSSLFGQISGMNRDSSSASNPSSRRSTLHNWYSIHSAHSGYGHGAVQPSFIHPPPSKECTMDDDDHYDEQIDDNKEEPVLLIDHNEVNEPDHDEHNENIDSLLAMGASWRYGIGSNNQLHQIPQHQNEQNSSDFYARHRSHTIDVKAGGEIFEDAINTEIKIELKNQIRKELLEDFQIKLQQKNIENRLKFNKQKEKIEAEKRDLVQKYEELIKKYKLDLQKAKQGRGASRNVSYANNNSLVVFEETYHDTFDDEKEEKPQYAKDRNSVNMMDLENNNNNNMNETRRSIKNKPLKENLYFFDKIAKLFTQSTLLWSLPLIK